MFFYFIIFLFLSLLQIPDTNIISFEFFSMQLRANIAYFLIHPSFFSILLDLCHQVADQARELIYRSAT